MRPHPKFYSFFPLPNIYLPGLLEQPRLEFGACARRKRNLNKEVARESKLVCSIFFNCVESHYLLTAFKHFKLECLSLMCKILLLSLLKKILHIDMMPYDPDSLLGKFHELGSRFLLSFLLLLPLLWYKKTFLRGVLTFPRRLTDSLFFAPRALNTFFLPTMSSKGFVWPQLFS